MARDYEQLLQRIYERLLEPGDWVVDIGAHNGRHSVPAARRVAPGGRVLAFEPLPTLTAQLREHAAREGVAELIEVHEIALSDTTGQTEFNFAVDAPWNSGLQKRAYATETRIEKIRVRVERLDEFMATAPGLRYIKIDAEGGELAALRGASGLVARFRPVVSFEFGENSISSYGVTCADMADYWLARDYRIFNVLGRELDREAFIRSATEQHVWDYVVVPAEAEGLAGRVFAEDPPEPEPVEPTAPATAARRAEMILGFSILLDEGCPEQIAAADSGEHDGATLRRLLAWFPPGGEAIYIGANIGFGACALGVRARELGGRVYAFEPVANNAARMRENVTLNRLDNFVDIVPLALGDAPGRLTLHMLPGAWTNNAVGENVMAPWDLEHARNHGWVPFAAPVVRLDDWARMRGLTRCDLIMIDAMGAEARILAGAREFIKATRPVVAVDVNPYWLAQAGSSLAELQAAFEPPGYEFCRQTDRRLLPLAAEPEAQPGEATTTHFLIPQERREALNAAMSFLISD